MFAGVLQTGCKKSATDTPVDNRQSRGSRPPIIGDVPFWDKNTSKLEHSVSRSGCGSRGLGLSGVGAARHQSTSRSPVVREALILLLGKAWTETTEREGERNGKERGDFETLSPAQRRAPSSSSCYWGALYLLQVGGLLKLRNASFTY